MADNFTQQQGGVLPTPQKRTLRVMPFAALFLFACTLAFVWHLSTSPSATQRVVMIEIPSGSSVRAIARTLEREEVIRSPLLFVVLARHMNVETSLGSGVFQFQMPMDVRAVLRQVGLQEHGIARLKITIPEGTSLVHMGDIFSQKLPNFDKEDFLAASRTHEGYLFPDTYFFFANATSGMVFSTLRENFDTKTAALRTASEAARKPWREIVVMASLIEEEAATEADRRIISGILWARMARGMKLQVDAPFVYLLGKASSELAIEDLTMDSPYNTYRHKGLPIGPITNPGLAALEAALHPTKTEYVYYLSDAKGVMHYAKTFEEHKLNKAKYLY